MSISGPVVPPTAITPGGLVKLSQVGNINNNVAQFNFIAREIAKWQSAKPTSLAINTDIGSFSSTDPATITAIASAIVNSLQAMQQPYINALTALGVDVTQ